MGIKIGLVILHTSEMERERAFYREVVGLHEIPEQSSPSFVMLAAGGECLLALTTEKAEGSPGGVEVGLEVEDIEATWQAWKRKEAPGLTEVHGGAGFRGFDARDPEGHLLAAYQVTRG